MFNIRTFHEPLMGAFDCPDPSVQTPRRERSTTALQALSLMNNAFVFDQAEHFSTHFDKERPDLALTPDTLVVMAYRLAFARAPSKAEIFQGVDFIGKQDLFSLCRVLFNTNEFLYVR